MTCFHSLKAYLWNSEDEIESSSNEALPGGDNINYDLFCYPVVILLQSNDDAVVTLPTISSARIRESLPTYLLASRAEPTRRCL
jgi:hypothetical protein